MTSRRFTAQVLRPDDGPGHAIEVPFDPVEVFGRARAPVRVIVNGHPAFRTTLASYGGRGWIGLRKAQLTDMGLHVDDHVTVAVEFDDDPRDADLPPELTGALAENPAAGAAFAALPPSHRREYAQWVGEAKRADTRLRRATATTVKVLDGRRPGSGAAPEKPRRVD
ncbi:MAG TPA: YdeI/OmpD-associated family protein [Nakamurella sp.]|nr:YdeI/OmpD-associated family protein [Nakamurella sp.]